MVRVFTHGAMGGARCSSMVRAFTHGAMGGARCSSMVRAFTHGAMGRQIDPLWGGLIELFLVPVSAPRLV